MGKTAGYAVSGQKKK